MAITRTTGVAIGLLLAVALVAGWYWVFQETSPEICRVCHRPIHPEASAVIEMAGKRETVCCVRCALFCGTQEHTRVRLVQVTDFTSGRKLAPEAAYYVEGSRVVVCQMQEPLLDQTKHPYPRIFDRCVPSVFAFASLKDAEDFVAKNGGVVLRLPELLREVNHSL